MNAIFPLKTRNSNKVLTIVLFVFLFQGLSAQTELKLNAVAAAMLIPNIGIETQISKKSTIQLDVVGSFWDKFIDRTLHVTQIFPEYRYYFKNPSEGFYCGGHVGFGMFTLTKWGYDPAQVYQSGMNTYYGITLGWKKNISERFGLEVFLGGGSMQAKYRGYYVDGGGRYEDIGATRPFDLSGELIPYRGGIMLRYRLPNKQ